MSLARLLAQLSILADREKDAIFTGYERPPVKFASLPEADREQYAHLEKLANDAWDHARSLGWDGNPGDAFE